MYNIQKAVSRLDYAPKLKEVQVTDFKKGLGNFTPKPDKPVSFAALKETLKKAGYTLASADMTVAGTLLKGESGWILLVKSSGQRLRLEGPGVNDALKGADAGDQIEITGDWETMGTGAAAREVISPAPMKKSLQKLAAKPFFATISFGSEENVIDRSGFSADAAEPAAPIRVTSPGLTVYKGGAVTPRLYFIKQHLGNLEVDRQMLDVSVSYTPSPRVQLEIEVPFSRTAFDDGVTTGSGVGVGNVTAWAKYRFFRKVKTYGDRQAALRVGLELPTGKKTAPTAAQINVPAFVRQQLTPINGGALASHRSCVLAGGRPVNLWW